MIDTTQRVDAPVPPEEPLPRKSGNPVLWLLALVVLFAAIWFFYNRSASNATTDASTTPAVIGGDAQQEAAQAERNRADANANASRATARAEKPARRTAKPQLADRAPEPIAMIQPKYPAGAYRAGEEGKLLVRAEVDASGAPGEVTLVKRSGSRELDRAALDAVRQSQFRPAIHDGKAVASAVEVPVEFKLADQ